MIVSNLQKGHPLQGKYNRKSRIAGVQKTNIVNIKMTESKWHPFCRVHSTKRRICVIDPKYWRLETGLRWK